MIAYVAAGRLAGYFEPYMHAWDCLAGYCLVSEAGGWHLPFPEGPGLTRGSQVLAVVPGAREDPAPVELDDGSASLKSQMKRPARK